MRIKFLSVFLIILVLPLMSAIVEFDSKSEFSQGETFLTKISGNFFKPITENDIKFFKNNVRISILPFVQKIDNDFYIYAQLSDKEPNNYSLVIENAKYYEGNQIIEEDLRQNFTITINDSDFSITPGFIFTEEDFSIELKNFGNQITISYRILNESEVISSGGFFSSLFNSPSQTEGSNSIILKAGETKEVSFNLSNFESFTIQKIQFSSVNSSYQIPIYINTEIEESTSQSTGNKIGFQPKKLNISLPLDSKTTRIVHLFNLVEENLEDLEITFSDSLKPYISLSIESISSLDENSSEKIELIFTSPNKDGSIEGQIRAKTNDDFYSTISITLNFIENYKPIPGDDITIQTCQEIGGLICVLNQECQGDSEVARDGICCLGICEQIEESSTGKIIGWSLILIIVGALAWFYLKKYKGVKNPVDLLKIAKGRSKR